MTRYWFVAAIHDEMVVQVDDNCRAGDRVGELAALADIAPCENILADDPSAVAHAQEFCGINEINAAAPWNILAKELNVFPNALHTIILSRAQLPWICDIDCDLHIDIYRPYWGITNATGPQRSEVVWSFFPRRILRQVKLSGITGSLECFKPYAPIDPEAFFFNPPNSEQQSDSLGVTVRGMPALELGTAKRGHVGISCRIHNDRG